MKRVGVVGARGIGRHHANWWYLEGAFVSAIVGTSEETLAVAADTLEGMFGFSGRGFLSLEALLREDRPDIVDVCSPPALHEQHVRAALEAGCDVLCEKPLVYAPGRSRGDLLRAAEALFDLADRNGARLGACTQYSVAGEVLRAWWREHRGDEPITSYGGHLESPARDRAPDPGRVWVDLSPHVISVLLAIAPDGTPDWASLDTHFDGYRASARLDWTRPGAQPIQCELATGNRTEAPDNIRQFVLNGFAFGVEGERGEDGVYHQRFETPEGSFTGPDMMRLLIRRFLAGESVAGRDISVRNLDTMLRVLAEVPGAWENRGTMTRIDSSKLKVLPGRAYPMGPMVRETGVRFTLFSRHATRVWLALFDDIDDKEPAFETEYDRQKHRTGDVWSLFVEGLSAGALYAFRVDGPWEPGNGHRFDSSKHLLDPYAKAIVGDLAQGTLKCLTTDDHLDWTDDNRPHTPICDSVIYETHVRGLTRHESSGVEHAGTYRGVVEKIPYLQELGVTAVELLPIQEAGEYGLDRKNPVTGEELTNYWAYNSIGFFAPSARYASHGATGRQIDDFRDMVAALHEAGIEVILDVVFNHTAEGNEKGPTLCFRGIDNVIYYMLQDDGSYLNYSGCGNTVNCNHPLVRDFIVDCLRYWTAVLHVDGFRFDLASILGRNRAGELVDDAPLIERIGEDPILRNAKLIAEAWDAGGAYQVGSFGGSRWSEWNGRYRDDVRRYWRGDAWSLGDFASRIAGSSDLYGPSERHPGHSINFVTAHDGFTLRDLVSYNRKHNEANGENNRDGGGEDYSWNCGVEGETDDPEVLALRGRMQRNFLGTLFVSLGVPMMLGGDEFGRTQGGNNNAYCQDNEVSWYDWTLTEKYAGLLRFTRKLIEFRKEHSVFRREQHFPPLGNGDGSGPAVLWLEPDGTGQRWRGDRLPLILWVNGTENDGRAVYIIFNPAMEEATFFVPEGSWDSIIDTAADPPGDFPDEDSRDTVEGETEVTLAAKSMRVLVSRDAPSPYEKERPRDEEEEADTEEPDREEGSTE